MCTSRIIYWFSDSVLLSIQLLNGYKIALKNGKEKRRSEISGPVTVEFVAVAVFCMIV